MILKILNAVILNDIQPKINYFVRNIYNNCKLTEIRSVGTPYIIYIYIMYCLQNFFWQILNKKYENKFNILMLF